MFVNLSVAGKYPPTKNAASFTVLLKKTNQSFKPVPRSPFISFDN